MAESYLEDVRHLGHQLLLVEVDDLLYAAHQVLLRLLVLVRESEDVLGRSGICTARNK